MAATMTAGTCGTDAGAAAVGPPPPARPSLRLVGADTAEAAPAAWDATPLPEIVRRRRPVSAAVRRRRVTLALVVASAVAVMVPLSGAGGTSHTTGPATAAPVPGHTYVVQPGDTLWSIATSADPTGDPRPLVAQMTAQVGTDAVVPGERVDVP